MTIFILFLFGAAIGSFLNVVALRYDPDRFIFSTKGKSGSSIPNEHGIGGRSHCPHCNETLRWFELVPILSFIFQGARCRRCRARISFRYPIVEIISGLIFVLVPIGFVARGSWAVATCNLEPATCLMSGDWLMAALWILVFESLLLMSLIDIQLQIIPDEINIFLVLLGLCGVWLSSYRAIELSSYFFGALFAFIFFGLIIAVTRGRGMGLGDLKLAVPLGLLFGWPNVLVLTMTSFIIGAGYGVYVLAFGGKTMKSAVPFGPFLAIGAAIAFFAGPEIISFYLSLMGIR